MQQSTTYAATTKRMNLLPVCHPPWAAHSSACSAPTLPLLYPLPCSLHVADCPCTAICAQQQQQQRGQQQLLQQTATVVGQRVISFTQTHSSCLSPLLPYPSSTTPLLYLSIGSRHSQLPFRIELNSNFYQFTKATAGSRQAGQGGTAAGSQWVWQGRSWQLGRGGGCCSAKEHK